MSIFETTVMQPPLPSELVIIRSWACQEMLHFINQGKMLLLLFVDTSSPQVLSSMNKFNSFDTVFPQEEECLA